MEKTLDEKLKREFTFDRYGRYAIIRDIINSNRKEGEKFKILDVGGRGNVLKKFLPDDEVFYLEPFLESDDPNFIKGDGTAMDLQDDNYDWVTSVDVFEHIPKEKREAFLRENIRVAKNGVILAAPFFSEEIAQSEFDLNADFKILSDGKDHEWLIEHIENGLPREDLVENFLKESSYSYQKFHNNDLFLWKNLMLNGFAAMIAGEINDKIREKIENFNYFYNNNFFPYDNSPNSYRKIFFIKKNPTMNEFVEKKDGDQNDLIEKILKKNKELMLSVYCDSLQMLAKLEKENNFIKSSKFWKMREYYLKSKSFFIPKISEK